jgi:hypothetical protein
VGHLIAGGRGNRTPARVMAGVAAAWARATVKDTMSKLLKRLRRHRRASERGISFGGPSAISLAVGLC